MPSSAVQPIVVLLSGAAGGNPTQYTIEKAFAHHQLDWRYLTVEVSPDDLGDAVRGTRAMGFAGGHCGDSYKRTVIPLLDRTTETAAAAGAVNLFFRENDQLVGENTEGRGLLESLRRVTDPADKRVALLGAGRIARAIALELAAAGAAEITVFNRTAARARRLAELLAGKLPVPAASAAWDRDLDLPPETDLLVNATSLGKEDPAARPRLNPGGLRPGLIVADVTIDPPQTWLLREAAARGCTTLDGLGMYIDQVAVGLKIWTGVDPDREVMREAIEEFLEL